MPGCRALLGALNTQMNTQSFLQIVMVVCQIARLNTFDIFTFIAAYASSQTTLEHLQQMCQMWDDHTLLFISCHPVRHPFDACAAWQAIDLNNKDGRYNGFLLSTVVLIIGFVCLPGTSTSPSLLVPYVECLIFIFLIVFSFALLTTGLMYFLPGSPCDISSQSCVFRRLCCDESYNA
jgi:hypothetical protein